MSSSASDRSAGCLLETVILAVSQRPFAATSDNAIPQDAERHMAQRAGARAIVEG